RLGHAVRTEHRDGAGRNFRQFFDKMRALGLEAFHHVPVVHDLVAHVDRRAILLQRALDDLDRAYDTGAETARLSQGPTHSSEPMRNSDALKVTSRLSNIYA